MNRTLIQLTIAAGGSALLVSTAAATPEIINESGFSLAPAGDYVANSFVYGVDVAASSGFVAGTGAPIDRIAVGATSSSEPAGRVFVYDATTGGFLYDVQPPIGAVDVANFGTQVALVDDTLVVTDNNNREFLDSSQVFVYDASTGAFKFELLPFGPDLDTRDFGHDIAIGVGIIAVTQPLYGPGSGRGAVYIYDEETGAPIDRIVGPDEPGVTAEGFGSSVAIAGPWIAIGRANPFGFEGGPQDVFIYEANTLTQIAHILPPAGSADTDRFGAEVALNYDTLVVCAPGDIPFSGTAGAAHTFDPATGAYRNTLALSHPSGPPQLTSRMNAEINDAGLIAIGSKMANGSIAAVRLFDDQTGAHLATLEPGSTRRSQSFGEGFAFFGNSIFASNELQGSVDEDRVLQFLTGPDITAQPESIVTGTNGLVHELHVTGVNVTAIEWLKDGVPVVDGPFYDGAQSSPLLVTVNAETEGAYTCRVTSGTLVTVTSEPAYIVYQGGSVNPCPADLAPPTGTLNIDDVLTFLAAFSNGC